jgi:hypothetical protein
MTFRKLALTFAAATLAVSMGLSTAHAQQAPAADNMATPATNTDHNWTTDQIITATVHQAWLLSGKDENNFFEIVKELAEISARNRNLVLPDNPEAGKKAGAYIKKHAKADHDQLLYAIVDKSVRMTGTPGPVTGN